MMDFNFRRLTDEDLPTLYEWLTRPHVASRWDGIVTLEIVQEKFQEHIHSKSVFGYIASRGDKSMAYVQAYNASCVGNGWWPNIAQGVWGIDQFLANEEDLGKGIGTLLVKGFTEFVFNNHGASAIITDPAPDNKRAIRCYEKAGFVTIGPMNTPDGVAMLMQKNPY